MEHPRYTRVMETPVPARPTPSVGPDDALLSFLGGRPAAERETVRANLVALRGPFQIRGLFFEGLLRIIRKRLGRDAERAVREAASAPKRILAFRLYPAADYYRLYYAGATALYPTQALPDAIERVSENHYPFFRQSMVGRTMSALVSPTPQTILTMLTKAYSLSVEGNVHEIEHVGPRESIWAARVEPVSWYERQFRGNVAGTMKSHDAPRIEVEIMAQVDRPEGRDYRFRITW